MFMTFASKYLHLFRLSSLLQMNYLLEGRKVKHVKQKTNKNAGRIAILISG